MTTLLTRFSLADTQSQIATLRWTVHATNQLYLECLEWWLRRGATVNDDHWQSQTEHDLPDKAIKRRFAIGSLENVSCDAIVFNLLTHASNVALNDGRII